MKPGDKVKIKTYEEIKLRSGSSEGWYNSFYADELLFETSMKIYCGDDVTIFSKKVKSYGTIFRVEENLWWWHEKWLIEDFLSDKDFEI